MRINEPPPYQLHVYKLSALGFVGRAPGRPEELHGQKRARIGLPLHQSVPAEKTNREIAAALDLGEKTVETRTELAVWVARVGLAEEGARTHARVQ